MKRILSVILILVMAYQVAAQVVPDPTVQSPPIDNDQPGYWSRLSDDERIGQPKWKVTLNRQGLPVITGWAIFIDNGGEEHELNWSDSCGETTGLMDALWTIRPAPDRPGKSNRGDLVIYSNGEEIPSVGSLEQGSYHLTYIRGGKPISLLLERTVN